MNKIRICLFTLMLLCILGLTACPNSPNPNSSTGSMVSSSVGISSSSSSSSVSSAGSAMDVPTNSPFYVNLSTESLTFTGDPSADFGESRLLYTDQTNDATNTTVSGAVTKQFHDLQHIYMAYTHENLFIGFKTLDFPDGVVWDMNTAGATYLYIDNGITSGPYSKGPLTNTSVGLTAAGITGTLGIWEQTGIISEVGKKISFFFKHFRPSAARDCISYKYSTGTVVSETWKGTNSNVGWLINTTGAATEIQIPLLYLFGDTATNIGTFYIAFRVDGALGDLYLLSSSDTAKKAQYTNAAAIDWAPEQNGLLITNWLAITNLSR